MKLLKMLALSLGLSVAAYAVTIQSFNGTGANSTTVEHTWDDSGNYTANGTITANGVTATSGGINTTGAFTGLLLAKTTLQLQTYVPVGTGQPIFCSNCQTFNGTLGGMCVSTAAVVGSFIQVSSATAVSVCK